MGNGRDQRNDIPRQHLAVAVAVGIAIGLALSLATDHWSELVVGLVLGLAIGLAYHGTGGRGGHRDVPGAGHGHAV